MNIKRETFGQTPDGRDVILFTLANGQNMVVKIMNYGGIITAIQAPDKDGNLADIVLGFNTFKEYQDGHPYFGALVGRYANRIAQGRFALNNQTYQLAINNGPNHIHGGISGFDKVVWEAHEFMNGAEAGVELQYHSRDGEEGYPGNLAVKVRYSLNDNNELRITYQATSDKPTIINLTQHSYFNLSGEGSGDILDHEIAINADSFTVVDADLIPTGEIRSVKGSPLDFTTPYRIGDRIQNVPGGYDHNYVLNKSQNELALAAQVRDPKSGRRMEVYTTQPGIQLYTANFLDGTLGGKSGKAYQKHGAFCLETQHFPDSPNQPHFPATVLQPGETYDQVTVYKFNV